MRMTCWNRRMGLLALGLMSLLVRETNAGDPAVPAQWTVGKPIVTYWAGPAMTDATAQQMAAGGWNVVWCQEQDLDVADRHGLRAMLFAPDLMAPATLDDDAKRARLEALIERVRSHPALYCYYIVDEPNATAFPALGRLVAYLRERDPAHMAYINLFPTYASNEQLGTQGDRVTAYQEHLRQYVAVVKPELISYDHYQFATDADIDGYFLNLAMIRDAALNAGVPFLNIVQACTWTPVRRIPTGDEMRYLVYTTLAYGGQGISYYVYSHAGHTGGIANADGTPTELYHALSVLNREFSAIASELQPLTSSGVCHLGMMPAGTQPRPAGVAYRLDPPVPDMTYQANRPLRGVLLGLFGKSADAAQATHVVVVNLDTKQGLNTTLTGPGALQLYDPQKRAWSTAGENRATLQLLPGGGRLVRLTSQ